MAYIMADKYPGKCFFLYILEYDNQEGHLYR